MKVAALIRKRNLKCTHKNLAGAPDIPREDLAATINTRSAVVRTRALRGLGQLIWSNCHRVPRSQI